MSIASRARAYKLVDDSLASPASTRTVLSRNSTAINDNTNTNARVMRSKNTNTNAPISYTQQADSYHAPMKILQRRAETTATPSSQSLTFGFAFMAILLSLLLFAHVMQRWSNRRRAEMEARMAALGRRRREEAEMEEVPRIWDVCLMRRGAGRGRGQGEGLRWEEMQPLAAHVDAVPVPSAPNDPRTKENPLDADAEAASESESNALNERRPIHLTMIISMPVSPPLPRSRHARSCWRESAKTLGPEDVDAQNGCLLLSDRPAYYEIGVMKVQR